MAVRLLKNWGLTGEKNSAIMPEIPVRRGVINIGTVIAYNSPPRFIPVYGRDFTTQCSKCGNMIHKNLGHSAWAIIGLRGNPYIQYYCEECKRFVEYPYLYNGLVKGGDE